MQSKFDMLPDPYKTFVRGGVEAYGYYFILVKGLE